MEYKELESLVIKWAKEKGIFDKSTPDIQCEQIIEEAYGLHEVICFENKENIIDSLGYILVSIIIQSEMQGLKLEDCLQSAYDVISKRNGEMINGTFVKDEKHK